MDASKTALVNSAQNQGGRPLNVSIKAGETIRASSTGTNFYLVIATAGCDCRPENGDFVTYQQGTGCNTGDVPFNWVELRNSNAFDIVISIWVGFSTFIDNRVIFANSSIPNVVYPTYSISASAAIVKIRDLSGGGFTDVNGVAWLALYRIALLIFNQASDTHQLIGVGQNEGGTYHSVATIYPAPSPLRLEFSGNFDINYGGASITCIVSEVYAAIPAIA